MKTTAEDFLLDKRYGNGLHDCELPDILIEFAKLHVEAALKEASEKAYARGKGSSLTTKSGSFFYTFGGHIGDIEMDKGSILNAYPLDLIK